MMNQQPRAWAESLLVAYVDGQLDPAQREAVEAALRDDAEARAIVSVLRSSASAVKHAYDAAIDRPVPESLRRLFDEPAAGGAEIVQFRGRSARVSWVRHTLPLAASVAALMIGFGAGYATFGDRGSDGTFVPAGIDDPRTDLFQAALRQALDLSDPGASRDYADETGAISGKVTVIGPVTTANLGDCREFRHDAVSGKATETTFGIACRSASGNWLLEAESPAGG